MSDSVGSVSVDVVPDARGWSEKLRAQIRDQTVKINADADTGEAEAKIEEVARPRTSNVKVKADTSQLSQGASKLDQFVGNLGLLPSLAIAGGAALVPLGAALGGVTAALAAPLLIAGGGATLFGFLAGFAVKDTQKQLKDIDKLQTKLGGLTKGTQAYKDAQSQLKIAQDNLSPAQARFGKSLDAVQSSFAGLLQGKSGQALLGPLSQGLQLLAHVLPGLSPIITAVSGAFTHLLGGLDDAVSGPGFSRFIHRISREVGPDIESFGHIAGNAISGVTGLILALDHSLGHGVLHGLERLSGGFADLGNNAGKSKGLQAFVDYFHRVGPQVADTLGAVARALGHITEALAPLGPPILRIIQGIADAISGIPVPVLTALAGATAGLVAFQKLGGFKAAGLISRGLSGGGGPGGVVSNIVGGAVQKVYVVNLPPTGALGGAGGVLGEAENESKFARYGRIAGQAGLLAGITYYGAKGVHMGVNNIAATQSTGFSHGTVGSDRPRTVFTHQAPGSMSSYVDTNNLRQVEALLGRNGNAMDALRQRAGRASAQIDQIGPRAAHSLSSAIGAVGALQSKLNGLHDKKIQVIAQTQSAISSLERLQALRIADKHFTVYQRNQIIEQAVGPGGGIGRHSGLGGGVSGGSGGGAVGRTPVHIHLDDNGKRVLTGHMEDTADQVYRANSAYDDARFSR